MAVERIAGLGHVEQERTRLEAFAAGCGEIVAKIDKGLGPHAVDIGNGAAGERRKAEAENGADIGLAHVGDDLLLDAAGGFQRLDRQQPLPEAPRIDGVGIVPFGCRSASPGHSRFGPFCG